MFSLRSTVSSVPGPQLIGLINLTEYKKMVGDREEMIRGPVLRSALLVTQGSGYQTHQQKQADWLGTRIVCQERRQTTPILVQGKFSGKEEMVSVDENRQTEEIFIHKTITSSLRNEECSDQVKSCLRPLLL